MVHHEANVASGLHAKPWAVCWVTYIQAKTNVDTKFNPYKCTTTILSYHCIRMPITSKESARNFLYLGTPSVH
jgi:hypothetical protein